MSEISDVQRSHTFLVRMWLEPLGDGQEEWRGQVRFTAGETRYFRDWDTLVGHLRAALRVSPDSPDACLFRSLE
jgi:hypothetical protein